MRTIIAGSRGITDPAVVDLALENCWWVPSVVISGGARGVDASGLQWAKDHGVPTVVHEADWDLHGRAAGPIRNNAMLSCADALVAIWDGTSPGTRHIIREAGLRGVCFFVSSRDGLPLEVASVPGDLDRG